jgi:CheY-like chemotaxis protein
VSESPATSEERAMNSIDLLVIDPSPADGRNAVAAMRQVEPDAATVRLPDVHQALRLMFERGLFVREPQVPRLILCACIDHHFEPFMGRLRSEEPTRDVPVIVASGMCEAGTIERSRQLGAQMHVWKNSDPDRYSREIQRAVILIAHA